MKWIIFILLAALSNGVVLTSMKALHQYSSKEYIIIYFLGFSSALSICSLISAGFKFKNTRKKEIYIGAGLGSSLIVGILFVIMALKHMTGTFVYTVVNGGAVILISITAGVLFKEKYSKFGIIGIVLGIISIILMGI